MKYYNSLYKILKEQTKKTPDQTAVIVGGKKYTYSFILLAVNKVTNWLLKNNIKPMDRVGYWGRNNLEFIISLFATNRIRGVFVPISHSISDERMDFILNDCSPSLLIIENQLLNVIIINKLKNRNLKIMVVGDENFQQNSIINWKDILNEDMQTQKLSNYENDLALIIYTSGTTSFPKGVMSRNKQIIFVTYMINYLIKNDRKDIVLCGLPFSFDYGLYQIFLCISVGATLVLQDLFFLASIPQYIKEFKITGFPVVPSILLSLYSAGLLKSLKQTNLRYITSTGDSLPNNIVEYFMANIPDINLVPMYGLTECKRVSIMPLDNLSDNLKNHKSSVGIPLPNTKAIIVNDNGEEVPAYIEGELVVIGENVMDGYWNDETETKMKYRIIDGIKHLYTGDLFYKDNDGYLYFIRRKESFIKCRGQKISPKEIENMINNFDYISSSIIVGIPDEITGEAIFVFYQLKENSSRSKHDILIDCKKQLPSEFRPKYVMQIFNNWPLTDNGKIDRIKLKEIAVDSISK